MINLSCNIYIYVWFLSYFYWCIISTKWQNKQKTKTKSTLSYSLEISQIMLKLLLMAASKKSDLVVAILEFILKLLSSYLLLIITTVVQLFFLRDLVQIWSTFLWWVVLPVFTSSLSIGLNQIGKVQLNWLMAPDPLRRIFFKGR